MSKRFDFVSAGLNFDSHSTLATPRREDDCIFTLSLFQSSLRLFVSLCLCLTLPTTFSPCCYSLSPSASLFYQAYFIFPPLFHFLPNLEIYPALFKLKLSSLFFLHKKIFLNNIKLFVIFQEIVDGIYLKFQGMIMRNCTHKYDKCDFEQ